MDTQETVGTADSRPEHHLLPFEWANTLTHALGVGLAIAGLSILVPIAASTGNAWRTVTASIYGSVLVLLYLASTFYHATRHPRLKPLMLTLDKSAIFLLIAGTYTPFLLVNMRGPWGWSLFGLIWGLAFWGIWRAATRPHRSRLSAMIYVGMGWCIVIALGPLFHSIQPEGLWLLLAGGLAYTSGVIFLLWRSLPHHHAIWHLFVLAGSAFHYFAVLLYA